MKTRKVKISKFLCLFVMALAVFVFSGCGGSPSNNFVSPVNPDTQSEDVTPDTPSTPTSPDVTPDTPSTPTSPDVTPDTPSTPTSPDVTSEDTAIVDTTLNVNDTATASNILSAVNAGAGTEVAALPEDSVGVERTLDDVSSSDLAAIPSDETPAVVLPIMTINKSAVYVWGVDLSSLTSGDYIFMHMLPEGTATTAGFFAAAADSDSYAFLDEAGNKITRVPASKRVNVAAYMQAGFSYAPIISTKKPDSSSDSDTPSVPVVPVPPTSTDVTPIVEPTSPDVTPDVPDEPTSGDTQPEIPDAPTSGDTPPEIPDGPTSGDTPPNVPDAPTSGDTSPDVPDEPTSGDTTTEEDDLTTDSEDVTGETYTSSTAFENALLINGATSTYTNITVTKTGDASGQSENYDWYGTNAAILAQGGANVTISGARTTIHSNAVGGNAVFAYGGNSSMNTNNSGDGTSIIIIDATITTESNNSGGIMVTGGGMIDATELTVTTSGGSSAAIRSDRGGGTISVLGGTYTTNGVGSPAIYSTAEISVTDADLTSNVAQVVVIEGGNSVDLYDARLTANHTQLNGQDTSYQAILIYQSQSGDASNGASSFTMEDSTLTNANGDIFHVTNTTTTITLSGSTITNNDESGNFLNASSDSWGTSGSNGGKVTLNADGQTINGNMLVDSNSTLAFNMSNSSEFNGAINTSEQTGTVNVVIDSTSTWTLTGNSYVSSLTNNGTINTGSYTLYVNGTAYSNN